MGADPRRRALCGRVDIVAEISWRVPLKMTGKHHRCACPRHDDVTFPLCIHPDKRFFMCFGCGFAGDVVDFVAEVDGVSAEEAMDVLCESLGIDLGDLTEGGSEPAEDFPGASTKVLPAGLNIEHAARELKTTPEALLALLSGGQPSAAAVTLASQKPAADKSEKKRRPKGEREKELASITSQENLFLAWRKVKTFAEEHDVYFDSKLFELYEERLEANLFVLRERLVRMAEDGDAYRPEPFRHLRLTKPKGGHRDIAIVARIEDRIVIQAVMNVLAPRIERGFSPNSFGHRLAANFSGNDLMFQRWPELWGSYRAKLQKFLWTPASCAYMKGDISSFYDKVDRNRLYDLIVDHAADYWTLSTIRNYLDYRLLLDNGTVEQSGTQGLPQGPAYAHFLANLYLDEFDRFVEEKIAPDQDDMVEQETLRFMEWLDEAFGTEFSKRPRSKSGRPEGLGYCRYVDDFFILFGSREEAERWRPEIEDKLAGWGLELSREKTDIYDDSNVEPVVQELKSRKYSVGKMLDNDESLTVDQREALYDVVENDFLTIAAGEDPDKAEQNVGFVVNKLSDSTFFERNREALLHLVIELLFSESVKHSAIGGLLKKTLPQIVRTHFAADFAEHLMQPGTPDFKRVLFLQAVQENRFYDALGPELQGCVLQFLDSPSFFVRFAAVNCLWANGQRLSFKEVRRRFNDEEYPENQGRLLHLLAGEGNDPARTAMFVETVAGDDNDTNYHALVASRDSPLALSRVVRQTKSDDTHSMVEWLLAILRCGNQDAIAALNRCLEDSGAAERVAEVYRLILGQAYQLYETGALPARSILELMDNLDDLNNQRIRDLLFRGLLVPVRERLAQSEEDDDLRERLETYGERAIQEYRQLREVYELGAEAMSEDVGFLATVGVTYQAYRRPDGVLDLWEDVEVRRIVESGRFESAYAWLEYLQRAREKGLADYRECKLLSDSQDEPVAVRVHYRVGSEYRRLADLIADRNMDEQRAAAVNTATARVHAKLRGLLKGKAFAPTITCYHVVADVSNSIKLICLGSAFGRHRYVSLDRKTHFEDARHWDSLFLGWLSFEMVTGQCPLTEAKRLAEEGGRRRFLTFSKKLAGLSIFYTRVLKRLTYESPEYRSSLSDGGIRRLLAEYRKDLGRLQEMERSGASCESLLEQQLLAFWEQRVVDTWRNPSFRRQEVEGRALYAYEEAREDTETFCAAEGISFGELPSTKELKRQELHFISSGVDHVLHRVEEMQSNSAAPTDLGLPVRFNLCLMHLVLRYEAMAGAFAYRHLYWDRWRKGEFAEKLLQGGEAAAYLAGLLARQDERLSKRVRKETLAPLAVDLTILVRESEEYLPFEKCGLAALAAFCHLMAGSGDGQTATRELLFRLASWEDRVAGCLGDRERLTLEVYRELGAEQQELLGLLRQLPEDRELHYGILGDNLSPFTSRMVTVEVEGMQAPVKAGGRAILALGQKSPDKNLTKGEPVSVDLLDGECVALSHFGALERRLFAPPPVEAEAADQDGVATTPGEAGPTAAEKPPNCFYKDGKSWVVRYEGRKTRHVKHMKGMFYISLLLAHPEGKPISCLEMQARLVPSALPQYVDYYANMSNKQLADEWLYVQGTEGDKIIEEQVRKELRKRRRNYQREYEELQETGLGEEALKVRKDMEDLDDYLKKAEGRDGKGRKSPGPMERARQNVQKNIVRARDELKEDSPKLFAHLYSHIHTRRHCSYKPDRPIQWKTVKGN